VQVDDSGLTVNGEAVRGTVYDPLLKRLSLHGVEQIDIAQGPPPSHVFELIRALAEQPTEQDLASRLRTSGADQVAVRVAAPAPPPRPGGKGDLGTDGLLRGDPIAEAAASSAPAIAGAADVSDPPRPTAAAPPPPAVPPALRRPDGPAQEPHSAEEAIALLEQDPRAANVGDVLAVLTNYLDEAWRGRRTEQALAILAAVIRCEGLARDAGVRRQYTIALKRMFSKALLENVAQLVTVPAHQPHALVALRRAGADGVEVLLDLLVAAPTVPERQAIFGALREMKEGTDQVVHMLAHPQWFVVRNVAELLGELGLEDAVPALAKLLDHKDERVRKAVALALAKIGSRAAAEPLRRALRDRSPGVRIQAALGVGGRKSSALAMPLVVAMEHEQDPEVERELIIALGRIGSSDAVQALIKFAKPAGRLFGRKASALRVAAVEALRLAATPAAVGMLQGLAEDGDKQVRLAAQEALQDVKR
jgi:hypothetical protein